MLHPSPVVAPEMIPNGFAITRATLEWVDTPYGETVLAWGDPDTGPYGAFNRFEAGTVIPPHNHQLIVSAGILQDYRRRVQVLARRGATGVVIMGMWLVYLEGPRQALSPAIDAVDGDGASQNGPWNYDGGYSPDAAARGDNANPTRWPGVSPSNPKGLRWSRYKYADLFFKYKMWNGNHQNTFYSPLRSATIVFRP